MAKFENRSDSENKGRSGRSRDDKGRKRSSDASGDKKKDDYKAKRSFSKNKVFREIKEERPARGGRSFGSDDKKPYKKDFSSDKKSSDRKPFKRDFDKDFKKDERPKRDFKSRDDKGSYGTDRDKPKRSFRDDDDKKSYRDDREKGSYNREQTDSDEPRSFREDRARRTEGADRPKRNFDDKDSRPAGSSRESSDRKPFKKEYKKEDKFEGFKKASSGERGSRPTPSSDGKKKRFSKPRKSDQDEGSRRVKYDEFEDGKAFSKRSDRDEKPRKAAPSKTKSDDGLIRLNKYLSNAGIASRRDADNLIQSGVVKVNGVVVDQLGYKIKPGDKVTYGDAAVKSERKVYLLLNKPKDYITTVEDPRERKTVMELISGACRERVYPVGRLDRNTTGLLLFTNDGELTTKLTHPKFGVKKVYHVTLNKGLKPDDFKAIIEGIELEDGPVKVDDLAFVGEGKKDIGIEIHSGRNRIVRRIFEHLGYDVIKLDRVVFAGLTKKDLPRGKHRFLTAKEISFLQMIG